MWTKDADRGEQLARRIQAGVVCVNDAQVNYTALNLPMGGWKASGLGTRHGAMGIRKYTKVQSLLVTRRALKREPFMFPYRAGRTRLLRRMFRAALRARQAGLARCSAWRSPSPPRCAGGWRTSRAGCSPAGCRCCGWCC